MTTLRPPLGFTYEYATTFTYFVVSGRWVLSRLDYGNALLVGLGKPPSIPDASSSVCHERVSTGDLPATDHITDALATIDDARPGPCPG